MQKNLSFRQLNKTDPASVQAFADFLSLCYKDRFQKGVQYLPDSQDIETTQRRIMNAEVWVAEENDQILASYVIIEPKAAGGSWWYRKADVAEFNQIAVRPDCRSFRLFRFLVISAEERAAALGARECAGTVPVGRKRLIRAYKRLGYRVVDYKWKKGYHYGAVIVSKTIQGKPLKSRLIDRLRRRLKYFRRYVKYGLLKK